MSPAGPGFLIVSINNTVNRHQNLSPRAIEIQEWLTSRGYSMEVVELPDSTRSAEEAASAIGCQVGQIVKSLIFEGKISGKPILILVSGSNRVDLTKMAATIGEPLKKADASFVREKTGFSIGGIPPIGHTNALSTCIDQDLLGYPEIWAAAGTPFAVFRMTPGELVEMTAGTVLAVT